MFDPNELKDLTDALAELSTITNTDQQRRLSNTTAMAGVRLLAGMNNLFKVQTSDPKLNLDMNQTAEKLKGQVLLIQNNPNSKKNTIDLCERILGYLKDVKDYTAGPKKS